jgi:hypothetical protein
LIDSTISFLAAFTLEGLVFSNELWAKLPVGVVLMMIVLLISWCVSTTFEAKTEFSFLSGVHVLKNGLVDFTRSLRGKTSERGSDAEDTGDEDGEGKSVSCSETLKGVFNRRPRRQRASTSSMPVDSARSNGCGPLDTGTVEMGGTGTKKEPGDVV